MVRKLLPLLALALMFTNCNKNKVPLEDLTNKERMNLLEISDPLIWNSLAEQSMEVDTTDSEMKSMTHKNTYPKKGYYFTIFEDLYPSQGDYDFNDVMMKTKYTLDGKKHEVKGTITAELFWRGGTLDAKLGLMFYSVKHDKEYTVIDNSDIYINGSKDPIGGTETYSIAMPEVDAPIVIDYKIKNKSNKIDQLWISWFLIKTNGNVQIHSSGFPISSEKEFELPQRDFITASNLPWGLTIEAEEFFIPKESEVFLNVYPEFEEWAESNGEKKEKWYENPDMDLIQDK